MPLTVMVPVREAVPVLVDTETVAVPSFVPEVGCTVNHEVSLLLTVQLVLDVMVNVFCWLSEEKFIEAVDKTKLGVACP